jgi:GNAT superfamily N-acetyltransferase
MMPTSETFSICASTAEDRARIEAITKAAGVFDEEEIKTVLELFDTYIKTPSYGYSFLSAHGNGKVVGYACWGLTALTQGAFDFYWLCTDPEVQKKGIGRALFEAVVAEVRKCEGRLIVIWTSSTPLYAPAHALYARMGCELAGRIRDFYKPGDDLLVYVKYL